MPNPTPVTAGGTKGQARRIPPRALVVNLSETLRFFHSIFAEKYSAQAQADYAREKARRDRKLGIKRKGRSKGKRG
jgi:hypothetical protein